MSKTTAPQRRYTAKPTDRAMVFADGRVVICSIDLLPEEALRVCRMLAEYAVEHGQPPGSVHIRRDYDGAILVEIADEIPEVRV